MKKTKFVEMHKVTDNSIKKTRDEVILEVPYSIYANDKYITTLFCSPENLEYLATGFLFTQKIIKSKQEIKSLEIVDGKINVAVPLDIGNLLKNSEYYKKSFKDQILNDLHPIDESVYSTIELSVTKIQEIMEAFTTRSETFINTGAAHSVALMKDYEILSFTEDVARHNAVDKVVGKALINEINISKMALLTSCRVSVEIISKAAVMSIPVIISRAATSSLAIELAKELKITLIGFTRGNKFNVYTNYIKLMSE
jgi:FdhD protein